MNLWHFTCDHGGEGIARDGVLRPNPATPWLPEPIAWATDLEEPLREALGLTSTSGFITCDRTAVRVRVLDPEAFVPWARYARRVSRDVRELLEGAPGARPMHWYVATTTVPAEVV